MKDIQLAKKNLIDDIEEFKRLPSARNAVGKPPLYQCKNEMGEDVLIALVTTIVAQGVSEFSLQKPFTDSMVYKFSRQFVQNRTHDSVHDLIAMFEMAQTGKLSKHYGLIDVLKLNEWLNEYLEQKSFEIENANSELRHSMWSDGISHEDIKALRSDLRDDVDVEHSEAPETFEKWSDRFKNGYWQTLNKKQKDEYMKSFLDASATSKDFEELYQWCLNQD